MSALEAFMRWLAHVADLITAHHPVQAGLIGLAIGWLICPGYMYFLAFISEWRWPKYRDQFKAFMPGNVFLGIVFGSASYLAASYYQSGDDVTLYHEPQWSWIPTGFGVLLVVGLSLMDIVGTFRYKEGDTDKYHWRQLISWTKVWHNVGVYGAYGYLLVRVGVPGLVSAPSSFWTFAQGHDEWDKLTAAGAVNDCLRVVLVLALLKWVGYLIADVKDPKFTTGHVRVNFVQWLVGLVVVGSTCAALAVAI